VIPYPPPKASRASRWSGLSRSTPSRIDLASPPAIVSARSAQERLARRHPTSSGSARWLETPDPQSSPEPSRRDGPHWELKWGLSDPGRSATAPDAARTGPKRAATTTRTPRLDRMGLACDFTASVFEEACKGQSRFPRWKLRFELDVRSAFTALDSPFTLRPRRPKMRFEFCRCDGLLFTRCSIRVTLRDRRLQSVPLCRRRVG